MKPRHLWPGCLAAICSLGLAVQGQTPAADQLREEMRQLRQDYEQRLQQLERRLQQWEPGPPSTNAPTLSPPVEASAQVTSSTNPAAAARQFAQAQYQRTTESRERALVVESQPWRERVEQVLQDFIDIHGYFRAGYGRNNEGGSQMGFLAPGAFAKYRLGNEAENYGELTFGKNFYVPNLFKLDPQLRPDDTPTGPIARVQATMSIYNPFVCKFTLAPQVSLGGRFMSRPVIRAFVTYAHWGDDFVGQVGGNDYLGQNEGLTYGVQMETWW